MTVQPDDLRAYVMKAAENKLHAAEQVNEVADQLTALERQASEARTRYDTAWKAAVDAGWSEAELKRIGLTPGSQPRRTSRPRKARSGNGDHPDPNPNGHNTAGQTAPAAETATDGDPVKPATTNYR